MGWSADAAGDDGNRRREDFDEALNIGRLWNRLSFSFFCITMKKDEEDGDNEMQNDSGIKELAKE